MGISCDLEIGSMDSETKPTCNRECLKLNGQDACDAVAETAKTPLSIDCNSSDANTSTTTVINLVSPTPPSEVCALHFHNIFCCCCCCRFNESISDEISSTIYQRPNPSF